MNTSKLADISEIVSSIAIVITLIFLTIQMQHNTAAIEASSRQGALNADTNYLIQAINHPEMLNYSNTNMTAEESLQRHAALILYFRNRENDFAQYQRGVMDEATMKRYWSSISAVVGWELNRNWWANVSERSFDPEFIAEVNRIIDKTPVYQGEILNFTRAMFESPDEFRRLRKSMTSG